MPTLLNCSAGLQLPHRTQPLLPIISHEQPCCNTHCCQVPPQQQLLLLLPPLQQPPPLLLSFSHTPTTRANNQHTQAMCHCQVQSQQQLLHLSLQQPPPLFLSLRPTTTTTLLHCSWLIDTDLPILRACCIVVGVWALGALSPHANPAQLQCRASTTAPHSTAAAHH